MFKKKCKKKKLEFSKILVITETIMRFAIILFCCVMIYNTKDLTPFAYLIPMTEAVMAVVYGFYFNKAKAENRIKLLKENHLTVEREDCDVNN